MGAFVRIRAEEGWHVSVGRFELIFEAIADLLKSTQSALAQEIYDSFVPPYYLDLSAANDQQIPSLYSAAERVYSLWFHEDGPSHIDAEYSPYILEDFSDLKVIIRTDARCSTKEPSTGTIIVTPDIVWTTPSWLYDLTLELTSAELMKDSDETETPPLVENLFKARVASGSGTLNLAALSTNEINHFGLAVDEVKNIYIHLAIGQYIQSVLTPIFLSELDHLNTILQNR